MCHVGTGVIRILSQVNVTGTVAWHPSPSSTKQLHQVLPWEATTEFLLYDIGGVWLVCAVLTTLRK